MDTITLPKKEYHQLLERAFRYEYLAKIVKNKESIFSSPPTKKAKEIVKAFKETNSYSPAFLNSLEKGLKRSSYFVEN